jgi:ferritin-like metal-binding protein YciE
MEIKSFNEMYVAELQELASAERMLAQIWPQFADLATRQAVKDVFASHGDETRVQCERVEGLLQDHGASATAHTDQAMQALLTEARKMGDMLPAGDLRDAGLIASAQKIAHYEMAAFGTAAALAGQLDLRKEQQALHTCLQEEKHADALLTVLAKGEVNPGAVQV